MTHCIDSEPWHAPTPLDKCSIITKSSYWDWPEYIRIQTLHVVVHTPRRRMQVKDHQRYTVTSNLFKDTRYRFSECNPQLFLINTLSSNNIAAFQYTILIMTTSQARLVEPPTIKKYQPLLAETYDTRWRVSNINQPKKHVGTPLSRTHGTSGRHW